MISSHILAPLVLMLADDEDQKVRMHTFRLIEVVLAQSQDKQELELFTSTEKPQSTKKVKAMKPGLSPIKSNLALQLLS